MEKKMTKKEMFAQIIALADGLEMSVSVDEVVDFCEKEIALLEKKASSKSKKEKEKDAFDEKIREKILSILEEKGDSMSASEILKELSKEIEEDLSIQKVSALLKKLCEEEDAIVEKFTDKRKSFFRLV